ncbi:hypothetical protein [Streptomyces sp. NPDC054765]
MTGNEPPQQRVSLAPQATHEETVDAASTLYQALDDAGLGDIRPVLDHERDMPYVKLHGIDAEQATRLEHLVRRGMDGNYSLAEELRCAVLDHGLVDFPVPLVCGPGQDRPGRDLHPHGGPACLHPGRPAWARAG